MSSDQHDPAYDESQALDWILGEVDGSRSLEFQREAATNEEFAQSASELRSLMDDLRGLTVEPTNRVSVAVRVALSRRLRLRVGDGADVGVRGRLGFALRVAAVAAAVLVLALLSERIHHELRPADVDEAEVLAQVPFGLEHLAPDAPSVATITGLLAGLAPSPQYLPPVVYVKEQTYSPYKLYEMDELVVQRFAPAFADVQNTQPEDVWFCATNVVAGMRQEFSQRLSPNLRREAIRAAGGSSYLASRIEFLATEIAVKIDAELQEDASADPTERTLSVQSVALALRAMMAGGSTLRVGENHESARRCKDWLVERLPHLHGGQLATALSGLMDVAVVSGPKMGRLVGVHASRLTESIIFTRNGHRPSMLNWQTTPAQLADAGQVLRIAPYFGTVSKEALLARTYLATHLAERLAQTTSERPDLLAAHLYGFGDLIERGDVELKLSLWHARDLVPEHYVALHHAAWSRFPLRPGWADFQLQLRAVSTIPTPHSTVDAAGLLLALAVHYAAPGSRELLAMR